MVHIVAGSRWLLRSHGQWMGVNMVLALLPLALAIGLFRRRRRRTLMWWVALVAFVALLPNAPYVVTDLIHLAPDIHRAPSKKAVVLGLLPLYGVFVLIGLESYAISLRLVRRYLTGSGWRRGVLITEAVLHVASAVGVLLGRFDRLNSWDVLHPTRVLGAGAALSHRPVAFLLILIALVGGSIVLQPFTTVAFRVAHRLAD